MKQNKLNSIPTGILTGVLLPAVCFILIIFLKKGQHSPGDYFRMLKEVGAAPRLLSLCLLPNLLLFFAFIRRNSLSSARGVIIAMFITGIVIIILKFA